MARGTRGGTRRSIHRESAYNRPKKTEDLRKVVRDPYEVARARNRVAYSTGTLRSTRPAKLQENKTGPQKLKARVEKYQPTQTQPQKKATQPTKKKLDKKVDQRLKQDHRCKTRPTNSKSKGGGAREFVPWCK